MEEFDDLVRSPDDSGALDLSHQAWTALDDVIWSWCVCGRLSHPLLFLGSSARQRLSRYRLCVHTRGSPGRPCPCSWLLVRVMAPTTRTYRSPPTHPNLVHHARPPSIHTSSTLHRRSPPAAARCYTRLDTT